jgi:hypothetical protein
VRGSGDQRVRAHAIDAHADREDADDDSEADRGEHE